MHHQAGVNFENFTEVKHFANREGAPGQTFKPGQSRPDVC